MTLDEARRHFIDAELFQLTLSAVTQRGGVYGQKLSEESHRPVHETLRGLLRDLSPQYETPGIGDERHIENIRRIGRTVTASHAPVLRDGKFRIGSAQKALNLHLKYRWCLGEIPVPPHCPFDSYVLRAIPGWRTRSWTGIDSIPEYTSLVAAARAVAGELSLADWELAVYNNAMNPQ